MPFRSKMGSHATQVPLNSGLTRALFHYQKIIAGKAVGRYIGREDDGELADEHDIQEVKIGNARELHPPAKLDSHCFELRHSRTAMRNFSDNEEIKRVYYEEMANVVKDATGAERVIVFDHTVRDTDSAGLNSLRTGQSAAPVFRVHTDYSDTSGPNRLRTLAEEGGYTGVQLTGQDVDKIMEGDFAIVNVWRSIRDEPVQKQPLAVLHEPSLDKQDFVPYEMRYPERTGENYGLRYNPKHQWFFYPHMVKDEVLVFKTYESRSAVARYCFHTSFDDPATLPDSPPRSSIEVRAIAILHRRQSRL